MSDLTIVIVSWNSKDYLAGCLRSVGTSGSAVDCAVIVVDNGSTDGTVEMLRAEYPGVEVIANQENKGFAGANNQAFARSRGRYLMLLNPDTVLHGDALQVLVRFLDENPSVWAVGPRMLNRDGSRQRSGVRFPTSWNILSEALFLDRLFPHSRIFGHHKELYVDPSVPRSVDYVQGACLIVRAEVLTEVGGLDEGFFMYFEETDWCYRIKQRGGEVYYCPLASVTHFGGGDFGHYDENRLVHYHRSLLRFYQKHYSLIAAATVRVVIALRSLVRLVGWGIVGAFRPSLRESSASSLRGYLRTFPILFERTP